MRALGPRPGGRRHSRIGDHFAHRRRIGCRAGDQAEIPDAIVGVGTIATPAQLDAAISAGAQFGVSRARHHLLEAIVDGKLPFSRRRHVEVMQVLEAGLDVMKFFPAVAAGGIKMLDSFRGPFPNVRFCDRRDQRAKRPDFFKLPNVVAVGVWLPQGLDSQR